MFNSANLSSIKNFSAFALLIHHQGATCGIGWGRNGEFEHAG